MIGINAVFRKAFRDSRRGLLWLCIGFGVYMLFVMSFYPTLLEQGEEFNDLLNSYPEQLRGMIYGGAEDIDLTAPGTFIHTYFASYGVMIIGVMAILQAFNAVTNAERDGTLDVMLSLPVARRTYLLARMANTILNVLAVLTVSYLVFAVSTVIWPEFEIGLGDLALGIYGAFFPLIVVTGFAYLLAALIPSRFHVAGAIAYLFLIGGYLVYGFSSGVDALQDIRPLFIYDYYNVTTIVREGATLGEWALLSAVALAYGAIAWWRIDKKDLGV